MKNKETNIKKDDCGGKIDIFNTVSDQSCLLKSANKYITIMRKRMIQMMLFIVCLLLFAACEKRDREA